MGKKIIVKGADFSANKIAWTDITADAIISRDGTGCLHYPSNKQPNSIVYSSTALYRNLIALNVSAYQGKFIRFTFQGALNSEDYVDGAYNVAFANTVNVGLPFTGTSAVKNAFSAVGYVPTNTTNKTYIAKIPANAVWLLVQNNRNGVANPKFEILT